MSNINKLENNDYMIVEALVKLAAIERLLIKANIITIEALQTELKSVSEDIMKHICEAAKQSQIENSQKKD